MDVRGVQAQPTVPHLAIPSTPTLASAASSALDSPSSHASLSSSHYRSESPTIPDSPTSEASASSSCSRPLEPPPPKDELSLVYLPRHRSIDDVKATEVIAAAISKTAMLPTIRVLRCALHFNPNDSYRFSQLVQQLTNLKVLRFDNAFDHDNSIRMPSAYSSNQFQFMQSVLDTDIPQKWPTSLRSLRLYAHRYGSSLLEVVDRILRSPRTRIDTIELGEINFRTEDELKQRDRLWQSIATQAKPKALILHCSESSDWSLRKVMYWTSLSYLLLNTYQGVQPSEEQWNAIAKLPYLAQLEWDHSPTKPDPYFAATFTADADNWSNLRRLDLRMATDAASTEYLTSLVESISKGDHELREGRLEELYLHKVGVIEWPLDCWFEELVSLSLNVEEQYGTLTDELDVISNLLRTVPKLKTLYLVYSDVYVRMNGRSSLAWDTAKLENWKQECKRRGCTVVEYAPLSLIDSLECRMDYVTAEHMLSEEYITKTREGDPAPPPFGAAAATAALASTKAAAVPSTPSLSKTELHKLAEQKKKEADDRLYRKQNKLDVPLFDKEDINRFLSGDVKSVVEGQPAALVVLTRLVPKEETRFQNVKEITPKLWPVILYFMCKLFKISPLKPPADSSTAEYTAILTKDDRRWRVEDCDPQPPLRKEATAAAASSSSAYDVNFRDYILPSSDPKNSLRYVYDKMNPWKVNKASQTALYRITEENKTALIVKVYCFDSPDTKANRSALRKFVQEWHALKGLAGLPCIPLVDYKRCYLDRARGEIRMLDLEAIGFVRLHMLKDLPLSQAAQKLLGRRLGTAIQSISRRSWVHGDVHPDNVMIHLDTGAVVLLDFGRSMSQSQEAKIMICHPNPCPDTPPRMYDTTSPNRGDQLRYADTWIETPGVVFDSACTAWYLRQMGFDTARLAFMGEMHSVLKESEAYSRVSEAVTKNGTMPKVIQRRADRMSAGYPNLDSEHLEYLYPMLTILPDLQPNALIEVSLRFSFTQLREYTDKKDNKIGICWNMSLGDEDDIDESQLIAMCKLYFHGTDRNQAYWESKGTDKGRKRMRHFLRQPLEKCVVELSVNDLKTNKLSMPTLNMNDLLKKYDEFSYQIFDRSDHYQPPAGTDATYAGMTRENRPALFKVFHYATLEESQKNLTKKESRFIEDMRANMKERMYSDVQMNEQISRIRFLKQSTLYGKFTQELEALYDLRPFTPWFPELIAASSDSEDSYILTSLVKGCRLDEPDAPKDKHPKAKIFRDAAPYLSETVQLVIGHKLTMILRCMHERGKWIHGGMEARKVYINFQTMQITVTDFTHAIHVNQEQYYRNSARSESSRLLTGLQIDVMPLAQFFWEVNMRITARVLFDYCAPPLKTATPRSPDDESLYRRLHLESLLKDRAALTAAITKWREFIDEMRWQDVCDAHKREAAAALNKTAQKNYAPHLNTAAFGSERARQQNIEAAAAREAAASAAARATPSTPVAASAAAASSSSSAASSNHHSHHNHNHHRHNSNNHSRRHYE